MSNKIEPHREQRLPDLAYDDVRRFDHTLNRATSSEDTLWIMPQHNEGLHMLVSFANGVVYGKEPEFRTLEARGWRYIERLDIGLNFQLLDSHTQQVSRDLEYAPHVELLLDGYPRHPIRHYAELNPSFRLLTGDCVWQLFIRYLERTRSDAAACDIRRQVADWQRNARENEKTLALYIDRLFAWHKSLMVVQQELTYEQARFNNQQGHVTCMQVDRMLYEDHDQYLHGGTVTEQVVEQRVGLDVAIQDRNELFAKLPRKRRLFGRMVGYVCIVAWSRIRGYFLRCAFLFDGSADEVQDHEALGGQIGNYWVDNVTHGRGDFHNCNRGHPLGYVVGRIGRHELNRRAELVRCLGFPARVDQYVRVKRTGTCKLLTMGRMPPPRDEAIQGHEGPQAAGVCTGALNRGATSPSGHAAARPGRMSEIVPSQGWRGSAVIPHLATPSGGAVETSRPAPRI
ncbi:hypothetical protein AWB69_00720 [Caballeronia udeis]|uniref:Uncharacterized protein n=1 Tax=Caballeronia udeis TaxID=1232866 RepID=A0A158F6R4_9BURK|nr:hypothetical protein [Caballeronia udeis]SAL15401.1 hypothetical protein AWB69_00720 [Caballeronia udeis]